MSRVACIRPRRGTSKRPGSPARDGTGQPMLRPSADGKPTIKSAELLDLDRQLDGALSSTRALPAIAEAVGDRLTVLADSGVRSGLDVVRMLALGAKGVLLGRAFAYALAARGGPGVTRLLDLIEMEMRVAMALTGARTVAAIDRSILA